MQPSFLISSPKCEERRSPGIKRSPKIRRDPSPSSHASGVLGEVEESCCCSWKDAGGQPGLPGISPEGGPGGSLDQGEGKWILVFNLSSTLEACCLAVIF